MNRIVVIGGGGHAKVLISVLRKSGHEILGYTDVADRGDLLGVGFLGTDDVLPGCLDRDPRCRAAIGVGKIDAGDQRTRLQARLETVGFALPAIMSPHAMVNLGVELGAGTVVFDGAVINSGTSVGRTCILNTSCTVDHDCRLGDDVHVAPGATLSGGVVVGDHCLVGVGASIIQGVRIGARILIGAGAVVVSDLDGPGVYVGCPAARIRQISGAPDGEGS